MKYLIIFYHYIIDKKIFCEKRVFYEKIGKMMSNIGYRSPFLPEWHSHKGQVRLCPYMPPLFSPRTTRTPAPVFPLVTRAPPCFSSNETGAKSKYPPLKWGLWKALKTSKPCSLFLSVRFFLVVFQPLFERIVVLHHADLVCYHIFYLLVLYVFLHGLLVASYRCYLSLWTRSKIRRDQGICKAHEFM